jgi:hypothetical protein
MKQTLLLLSMFFLIASCNNNEEQHEIFRLDPDAKVYVKPDLNAARTIGAKNVGEHLTPLEVVKQATFLNGYNYDISSTPIIWTWVGKDTISETPALLRWGTDIIYDTDGYGHYGLQTEFINSVDLVICKGEFRLYDTIAYISNNNILTAKAAILEALAEKDTVAVYDIFKNAFKFIPITGAEWKALKAQGLN